MLEIIKQREVVERDDYSLCYEWEDCPGAGFGFPCTDDGEVMVEDMTPLALENYQLCRDGKMRNQDGKGVIYKGKQTSHSRYVKPAIALCVCGHEISLASFTNTCAECGRDYNSFGQQLASRNQWGEETGESVADILSVGHTVS